MSTITLIMHDPWFKCDAGASVINLTDLEIYSGNLSPVLGLQLAFLTTWNLHVSHVGESSSVELDQDTSFYDRLLNIVQLILEANFILLNISMLILMIRIFSQNLVVHILHRVVMEETTVEYKLILVSA